MTDDFATRVTTALQALPHAPGCDWLLDGPDWTGVRRACTCDRETRQGALVARVIECALTKRGWKDDSRDAALRVLTGEGTPT